MSDWTLTPIKKMGRVVTGKTPPKSNPEYFDGDTLFVSPKDLDWDSTHITSTQTKITEKALEKFRNQVLPKNAVMYTSLSFGFGKIRSGFIIISAVSKRLKISICHPEHGCSFR